MEQSGIKEIIICQLILCFGLLAPVIFSPLFELCSIRISEHSYSGVANKYSFEIPLIIDKADNLKHFKRQNESMSPYFD